MWLDQSSKQLSSLHDLWSAHEVLSADYSSSFDAERGKSSGGKRKRPPDDDFSMVSFKNVKLAERVAPHRASDSELSPVTFSDSGDDFADDETIDSDMETKTIGGVEWRTDVGFNQAIGYVNKVKNHFRETPETYKEFLTILYTYQQEKTPIQEVYIKVMNLFQPAPHLLEDFKLFLPVVYRGYDLPKGESSSVCPHPIDRIGVLGLRLGA